MSTLTIVPLSERLGVEVLGLDLHGAINAATAAELIRIWQDAGVVLFRGIGTSPEAVVKLSRVFGELEIHPIGTTVVDAHPELISIRYEPPAPGQLAKSGIYEVNGEHRASWLPWHSDLVYLDTINRGGILRMIRPAERDGETGFIDRIAAYDSLPERLRAKIADLSVVYQLSTDIAMHRFLPGGARQLSPSTSGMRIDAMLAEGRYPKVVHPMVYRQKETGRPVLNISPMFALGILGMENAEGDALLAEVIGYLTDPSLAYYHRWEADDMILFDNWRTLHSTRGHDVACSRNAQRTTIRGDYALGRVLDARAA